MGGEAEASKEMMRLPPKLAALLEQPSIADALEALRRADDETSWNLAWATLEGWERFHDALALHLAHFDHLLGKQKTLGRMAKGEPLVWAAECFHRLGFPAHAKRYLMLTLVEDAIGGQGVISPTQTGVYWRLVWRHGLSDAVLSRYAQQFHSLAAGSPAPMLFPEELLLAVDTDWMTELPSPQEAFWYQINSHYVRSLLDQLGDRTGRTLERLAGYLMSCMPGCRTRTRVRSVSTDIDVLCAIEGNEVDFRSEFGRYFACECKDWSRAADITTMAKFAFVLDSIGARFGILFSKNGASDEARREQLKVHQHRGIVIVIVGEEDLESVALGANFIAILRKQYERVRLDLV